MKWHLALLSHNPYWQKRSSTRSRFHPRALCLTHRHRSLTTRAFGGHVHTVSFTYVLTPGCLGTRAGGGRCRARGRQGRARGGWSRARGGRVSQSLEDDCLVLLNSNQAIPEGLQHFGVCQCKCFQGSPDERL